MLRKQLPPFYSFAPALATAFRSGLLLPSRTQARTALGRPSPLRGKIPGVRNHHLPPYDRLSGFLHPTRPPLSSFEVEDNLIERPLETIRLLVSVGDHDYQADADQPCPSSDVGELIDDQDPSLYGEIKWLRRHAGGDETDIGHTPPLDSLITGEEAA